jgi:hypothetical protein
VIEGKHHVRDLDIENCAGTSSQTPGLPITRQLLLKTKPNNELLPQNFIQFES